MRLRHNTYRLLVCGLLFTGHGRSEEAVSVDSAAGVFQIEVIGDSIARGVGLSDEPKKPQPELAFPTFLAGELNVEVQVQGWPGAMAGQIALKYGKEKEGTELSKQSSPDLILINLGANHRHHSNREFSKQMNELLEGVRQAHPETPIVLLNFFRMRPNRLPTLMALKKSRGDEQIIIWDMRACLVGYTDIGIHPDAKSHVKLAIDLADRIRKEGWIPEVPRDESN